MLELLVEVHVLHIVAFQVLNAGLLLSNFLLFLFAVLLERCNFPLEFCHLKRAFFAGIVETMLKGGNLFLELLPLLLSLDGCALVLFLKLLEFMDVRVKLDLELCLLGDETVLLKGDFLMLVFELMELGVFLCKLDLELAIFFVHVADVIKISLHLLFKASDNSFLLLDPLFVLC